VPIYEYQCQSCGKVTEAWQKLSDASLAVCPHCSGQLKKVISCSSFHLKGSGWYVTDYAGHNAGNSSSKENTSDKPSPDKASSDKPSPAKE
jgi:putative FmdB family regulatory protein